MTFNEESKLISIVLPCFNEEENIPLVHEAICAQTENLISYRFEFIFVDDGSSDLSWSQILTLREKDSRVKGVRLTRNFGHNIALEAGVRESSGAAIIMMDADLQHPPSLIPELVHQWENGVDIVNTLRQSTTGSTVLKRWTSKIFYALVNSLSESKIGDGEADFRLITRNVADTILSFDESPYFFRGLIPWTGFKTEKIDYVADARIHGTSKFSLPMMLDFARLGVTTSSKKPLVAIMYIGIMSLLISILILGGMLSTKIFVNSQLISNTSIFVVLSIFVVSLLICIQGIIAIYLVNILDSVSKRPNYLIGEIAE
jgi:glycosyltransferase involved in cell wall biosynthesis